MDRLIEVKINGMHLTKDNNVAGVQHEANATVLRIEFDPGWDDCAKKVTFWNALGTNPVERTLTADLLEDITKSARIYLCPIPGETMTEAGKCKFVVDGWISGKRQRSIEDTLKVKPADFIEQADQPVDPTPTQAEQLQQQVDILLGDIQKEAIRAETARTGAETAQGKAEAAQAAAETAKNGAETAQGKAEAAQAAAEKAKEGVEAARDEAKTSETNAKASETAAKTSETNAKASEEAAKSAAEQAAEEAAQKTDALLADKVAAAREAEANAKASENAAKTSETNAKASETAAKTSETKAKDSETAAKASETAAKTSESSAASSASSAASSKAAAETAQGKAEAAQAAAEKARNEAEGIVGGDYISRPEAKALVDQGVSNANEYTDRKIAAIPAPDVSGQIQAHNTDGTAHGDIRQAVEDHAGDHNNPHGVTKGQVGLGNVDNTADTDKPVSTAQAAAIADAKNAGQAASALAARVQDEQNIHVDDYSNPHNVTAEQVGAIAAGAVGNLHVWERVQTYADPVPEVPAGYTLGEVEENVLLVRSGNENETRFSVLIYYADSVSVSLNGDVTMSMTSAKWVNCAIINDTGNPPLIAGKFIMATDTGSNASKHIELNQIFYVPSDANWNGEANSVGTYDSFISKLQRVTGYPYTPAIPAGTHVDYLTSTDRNAYPKQSAEGGQDASYVLGDVVTSEVYLGHGGASNVSIINVSDSISVSDDGTITQTNPQRVTIGYGGTINYETDELTTLIAGKFLTFVNKGNIPADMPMLDIGNLYYIPSSVTVTFKDPTNEGMEYHAIDKYQPVTGYPAIPANTVITYLGQLGGGARIEVGSYVGTGTYGQSNPNSLTFGFEPKLLIIRNASSSNEYLFLSAVKSGRYVSFSLSMSGGSAGSYTGVITLSGNIVSWYADDSQAQMNRSDYTFHYIALG